MTIKVEANVIDLRRDQPKASDRFFVDTNVWYWICYSNASHASIAPKFNQTTDYPAYIDATLTAGSTLYRCTLSFAELAHIIERDEFIIFNQGMTSAIKAKSFRHDYPAERTRITTEIENTWNLTYAFTAGMTLEVNADTTFVSNALVRLKQQALDGYDLFMIEAMIAHGISQIITDDRDYGVVPGITVFTANNTLINAAAAQGKLIKR